MKNTNSKLPTRSANSRKAPTASKTSAVDRKITRKAQAKKFSFAKTGVVPPGTYKSEIVGIEEAQTKAGEEAVDVLYELTSTSGRKYHVRMRYPVDGYFFEELCDALLDAGLAEGSKLSEAVGLEEEVELAYSNGERIGSFVNRWSIGGYSDDFCGEDSSNREPEEEPEEELDEDEFDDFLEDED